MLPVIILLDIKLARVLVYTTSISCNKCDIRVHMTMYDVNRQPAAAQVAFLLVQWIR